MCLDEDRRDRSGEEPLDVDLDLYLERRDLLLRYGEPLLRDDRDLLLRDDRDPLRRDDLDPLLRDERDPPRAREECVPG